MVASSPEAGGPTTTTEYAERQAMRRVITRTVTTMTTTTWIITWLEDDPVPDDSSVLQPPTAQPPNAPVPEIGSACERIGEGEKHREQ